MQETNKDLTVHNLVHCIFKYNWSELYEKKNYMPTLRFYILCCSKCTGIFQDLEYDDFIICLLNKMYELLA